MPEDVVDALGDRERVVQEVGVLDVLHEAGVGERRLLPWVASADHVDQDDAERPDVAECGIVWPETRQMSNAFCEKKT